ncbi:MAG: calcium-binding protein, partial [Donghicola eburneus]|nr:calcium-binding protein [Donghicola eburneus]
SGRDKVLGFKAGSDVFGLTEADITFDELSFEQSGKFVLVEFEDVDILVRGSSLSDLNDADNFIF